MRRIEVFFFDIGGVLLDHRRDKTGFHQKVAVAADLPIEAIVGIHQKGIRRYWENLETGVVLPYQLYTHYTGVVQGLLPIERWGSFRRKFTYAYFCEAFGNVFVKKPKVIDFVGYLRSIGCKVILVSNNNIIHYEYCLRTAPQLFALADDRVLSHTVGFRKPDPAIWRVALEVAGDHCGKLISPKQVFCVDDKPENVASFKALGGNGSVFRNVEGLKEDLRPFGFEFKKVKIPA